MDYVELLAEALIRVGQEIEREALFFLELLMGCDAVSRNTQNDGLGALELAVQSAEVAALGRAAWCAVFRVEIQDNVLASQVLQADFLVTGCIVWTTRKTITKGSATEPTWAQALIIGCAQAFAILPGITRSGTTLATAMALGMAPLAAAEFSFLMGVIAMAGAAVLLLPELTSASPELMASIWAGGAAALISGLLALVAFVWLLKSKRFHVFAWYAWAAGSAFLVWLSLS